MITVTAIRSGVPIRADYRGGAYIDLSFGLGAKPIEVINVWDYETDKPTIPHSKEGVLAALNEWMADNDKEWPEWLEGYLENSRY